MLVTENNHWFIHHQTTKNHQKPLTTNNGVPLSSVGDSSVVVKSLATGAQGVWETHRRMLLGVRQGQKPYL